MFRLHSRSKSRRLRSAATWRCLVLWILRRRDIACSGSGVERPTIRLQRTAGVGLPVHSSLDPRRRRAGPLGSRVDSLHSGRGSVEPSCLWKAYLQVDPNHTLGLPIPPPNNSMEPTRLAAANRV